jgi:hypothetical protein
MRVIKVTSLNWDALHPTQHSSSMFEARFMKLSAARVQLWLPPFPLPCNAILPALTVEGISKEGVERTQLIDRPKWAGIGPCSESPYLRVADPTSNVTAV